MTDYMEQKEARRYYCVLEGRLHTVGQTVQHSVNLRKAAGLHAGATAERLFDCDDYTAL